MKNKDNLFMVGFMLDVIGLILILSSTLKNISLLSNINSNIISMLKIVGGILFGIGLIICIIGLVMIYKYDNVIDKRRDLVIEGKAGIITILIMNVVLLLLFVMCILMDEYFAAILFGLALLILNVLNRVLIAIFSKGR